MSFLQGSDGLGHFVGGSMVSRRLAQGLLAAVCMVGLAPAVRADGDEPKEDTSPPQVGRPRDVPFSEASGDFRPSARAEPTVLEVEKPLTLTLTVHAIGAVRHPPQRPDLRQWEAWPAFAEQFYVEDLPDSPQPDPKTWEFAWRLKPRRADVTEVPGLPFAWYNPKLLSKRFQVKYTDPIPLQVRAQASVPVPIHAPARLLEIAPASAVLARRPSLGVPGPALLAILLLAPPVGCAAWYLYWRRLYPDAARRVRQRRSRAAHLALRRLHEARRLAPDARAGAVATAVTGYLQGRLDLGPNEPTPAEAEAHLRGHGLPPELAAQAARFYKACDTARFLPGEGDAPTLADEAERFILAVEGATCPPVPS